jgi:uncharacterized protein YuzE
MTTMAEPEIFYDEPGDTLYISFSPGETGAGLDLNDHILLRVDKQQRRAIGITLISFSILANRSAIGPRSIPLTGLEELSPELQELALEILQSPPVSEYLILSVYSPAGNDVIPLTTLNTDKFAARAA